jgi:methyl-accepting chemotaxis protein
VNRNFENVANATGQMSTTIRDIAKNASEASRIAGEARKRAADTNTIVINLGNSTAKIGEVIKLVTSIAHKTNLLALNATIEAARAGEVGAGFAVVASEVKELARQTATSAEEISGMIEAIRGDAKEAIDAISSIDGIIAQVHTISTSIATAVEEQSASTDQMSSSLAGATKSSRDVAENIRALHASAIIPRRAPWIWRKRPLNFRKLPPSSTIWFRNFVLPKKKPSIPAIPKYITPMESFKRNSWQSAASPPR